LPLFTHSLGKLIYTKKIKNKNKKVTASIIAMSQDTGAYTLDVDASSWAAGAVLQQEQEGLLRVQGYASKISQARKNVIV